MSDVVAVFLAALATALATGLGALPLAFGSGWDRALPLANAAASGFMLAASGLLIVEGVRSDALRTAIGAAAGIALIMVAGRYLHDHEAAGFGALSGADARRALLVIGVMTVHSAAEGIGVGVSFGGGDRFGMLIALAIAIHNIPEGLAIALVIVPRGGTVRSAALWSIFSSLPQPLLAVPAFLLVEWSAPLLGAGFGLAAGAMVWMVGRELLPEALAGASRRAVAASGGAAFLVMVALQLAINP